MTAESKLLSDLAAETKRDVSAIQSQIVRDVHRFNHDYQAVRGRWQMIALRNELVQALAEWRALWQLAADDELQRAIY